MNVWFAQTLALLCLVFLLACQGSSKSHASSVAVKSPAIQAESADELPMEQKPIHSIPVGVTDPFALPFILTPEPLHDAVDFTFGVAALEIPTITEATRIVSTRAILNGSTSTLSALQKDHFTRLCRDIAVSREATQFVPADSVNKGEKLYLMWRSYYSSSTKELLSEVLMAGGHGIECLLTLNLGGTELNIGFDPAPTLPEGLGGTANFEKAIYFGLALPRILGVKKPLDPNVYVPIPEEAKITLWVEPLKSSRLLLTFGKPSVVNECALVVRDGKTEVANPYAINQINFEVTSPTAITVVQPRAKATGGRLLPECQSLKLEGKNQSLLLDISCGQYQAIKDQGVEAACGWDLVVSNNADPENTMTMPIQLPKIAYKTVEVTQAKDALLLFPRSALNPVRSGDVEVNGFNVEQRGAIEDLFDLWIALDEEGFRRDFSNQIKRIDLSTINGCTTGAGAYTPYGADTIFWCLTGGMAEKDVSRRYTDPQMFVYRSMLAYHETRHSKNWKHDNEVQTYKPCEGTAHSAFLAYQIVTQCQHDYCKVMRDGAIHDYKLELNYDYDQDTTGRKAQGTCKTWSTAMGIHGGGF